MRESISPGISGRSIYRSTIRLLRRLASVGRLTGMRTIWLLTVGLRRVSWIPMRRLRGRGTIRRLALVRWLALILLRRLLRILLIRRLSLLRVLLRRLALRRILTGRRILSRRRILPGIRLLSRGRILTRCWGRVLRLSSLLSVLLPLLTRLLCLGRWPLPRTRLVPRMIALVLLILVIHRHGRLIGLMSSELVDSDRRTER